MEQTLKRFEMEKFDGTGDFELWKCKLLAQLILQGLESVFEEDNSANESGYVDEVFTSRDDLKWEENDRQVKNLIGACLGETILRKVMDEKSALGMWKALEKDYELRPLPSRIYLKHKFASYRMDEHKPIEENLCGFMKLVSDMASLKIVVSDEDQAIQLLTSLPPQYEPLVHTLKYGTGKDTLSVSEVTSLAYAKEVELKQEKLFHNSSSANLLVEPRGRTDKRDYQVWRPKSHSRSKSRASTRRYKNCFVCGEEGHWKRDCPVRREKRQEKANVAIGKREPMVLTVSTQDTREDWLLDSGCTFHITQDRDSLFDFTEVDGGKVLMANNTHSEVRGIGKVKIVNPDNSEVILTDVRYMPDMNKNLISYAQLEKRGCKYKGEDFDVTFYKQGRKMLTERYKDGLYHLQGKVVKGRASVHSASVDKGKRKVSFCENLIRGPGGAKSSKTGESSSVKKLSDVVSREEAECIKERDEISGSQDLTGCMLASWEKEFPRRVEKSVKSESSQVTQVISQVMPGSLSQEGLGLRGFINEFRVIHNRPDIISLKAQCVSEGEVKVYKASQGSTDMWKRKFYGKCLEKCMLLLKSQA